MVTGVTNIGAAFEAETELTFYSVGGTQCDPGTAMHQVLDAMVADLGRHITPAVLVEVVQGLLIHVYWAPRYGVELDAVRLREVQLRAAGRILARVLELDSDPLVVQRKADRKVVGTSRDFAVLLCALAHRVGIPARARSGYATYFIDDHFEDHWVAELWSAEQDRWVLVDAQLDALQRDILGVSFDPLDVPRDQLLVAGRAWRICRTGAADAHQFGIGPMSGSAFVAGNVLRDLLALNKLELLPWDPWKGIPASDAALSDPHLAAWFDRVASLTAGPKVDWARIRSYCAATGQLRQLPGWLDQPGRGGPT